MTAHSSSLLDRIQGDSLSHQWIRAHLDYARAEWCLIWPFSRDDSGYAMFGGKSTKVHRVMCEYRHGPAPSDRPIAAHECGKGHLGCVNPNHMTWKTVSENVQDIARHGNRTKRFKLTPAQVDEIRALKDRARTSDIATQFGVTVNVIRQIFDGRIWCSPNNRNRILSESEVRLVRATPWKVKSARQMAEELGVTISVVQHIRSGNIYKWVSDVEDAA